MILFKIPSRTVSPGPMLLSAQFNSFKLRLLCEADSSGRLPEGGSNENMSSLNCSLGKAFNVWISASRSAADNCGLVSGTAFDSIIAGERCRSQPS